MLELAPFYWLLAALLATAAWRNARERRFVQACFWAVLALQFAGGDWVIAARKAGNPFPAQLAGVGVIALAVLALRMRRAHIEEAPREQRLASARRLGHRLLWPALLIPLVTLLVVVFGPKLAFGDVRFLGEGSPTLIGLSFACVVAAIAALRVTRLGPRVALAENRRLLDTLGWAALLPMLLATLGGVFAASGVGDAVAACVSAVIPVDSRIACLLAYALGMVLFTMIMGNAFAAFPVMTAGIGLPLLVQRHGADPAILGSLGMLTGYCGTLLTPMAANFNLVPAALLELDDPNGVIRAQVATALPLLAVNLALMALLVFR